MNGIHALRNNDRTMTNKLLFISHQVSGNLHAVAMKKVKSDDMTVIWGDLFYIRYEVSF